MNRKQKKAVRLSGSKNKVEKCKTDQNSSDLRSLNKISDKAQSNYIRKVRGLRENFGQCFVRLFNALKCSEHVFKDKGGF